MKFNKIFELTGARTNREGPLLMTLFSIVCPEYAFMLTNAAGDPYGFVYLTKEACSLVEYSPSLKLLSRQFSNKIATLISKLDAGESPTKSDLEWSAKERTINWAQLQGLTLDLSRVQSRVDHTISLLSDVHNESKMDIPNWHNIVLKLRDIDKGELDPVAQSIVVFEIKKQIDEGKHFAEIPTLHQNPDMILMKENPSVELCQGFWQAVEDSLHCKTSLDSPVGAVAGNDLALISSASKPGRQPVGVASNKGTS
jgi:hypothetical protein